MTTEPCARCTRPMTRNRTRPLPDGVVRHMGLGKCSSCYNTDWQYANGIRGTLKAGRRRHVYDVDEVVVERAIAGDRPVMNPAEYEAALQVLIGRPLTAREIADRLGCTQRSVVRGRGRSRKVTA